MFSGSMATKQVVQFESGYLHRFILKTKIGSYNTLYLLLYSFTYRSDDKTNSTAPRGRTLYSLTHSYTLFLVWWTLFVLCLFLTFTLGP